MTYPNTVISMPSQLFTMRSSFKAVANGSVYIGEVDTDPTIPTNQIQVYIEQENGTLVPVVQPIKINAAGFLVYEGNIASFVIVELSYSMAVHNSFGSEEYYFSNASVNYASWALEVENRICGQEAKFYYGSNGACIRNGDTVPAGTTHVTVLINEDIVSVALSPSPSSNSVVSSLTESGAMLGTVATDFSPWFQALTNYTALSLDDMLLGRTSGGFLINLSEITIGSIWNVNGVEYRQIAYSNPAVISDFENISQTAILANSYQVDTNLSYGAPLMIFAHRGFDYGSEPRVTPQNTILAFSLAINSGASGIEADVSVSSDGVPYLFHDTTVDDLTDGTGTFTSLTSTYIDSLTLDSVAGTIYSSEKIPKLIDVLKFLREKGVCSLLELKNVPSQFLDSVIQDVISTNSEGISYIIFQSSSDAVATRINYPTIKLGAVVGAPTHEDIIELSKVGLSPILECSEAAIKGDQTLMTVAKTYGVELIPYTVGDSILLNELKAKGVRKVIASRMINKEGM
ncbi:phage tailspike protein [Vibrio diazotrophicus]|uniref:phage tailspike protein n=1 Tax=Vibrio diazotrophicus TaxID=685 RepID=UPI0015E15863|nr:phage tailspike protein [Vibrio diazotrophicus]